MRFASELCGRSICTHAPSLDDAACMRQAAEPVYVQTLIAKLAVEAFNVGVLVWLAGANERQMNVSAIRAFIEHLAVKFWAVIDGDRSG